MALHINRGGLISALEAVQTDKAGFGCYLASDYDCLLDHPFEMGTFVTADFIVNTAPHKIAITGVQHADMTRLCQDLTTLCHYYIDFFGGNAPFTQYIFMVMALGKDGYGGLEHRSSCALHCFRDTLPVVGMGAASDAYVEFLSLCSHEYFHVWNIKRIKPDAFLPYQLHSESYTPLLWVFEGFTAYYEDIALVRTKLITVSQFLEQLALKITRYTKFAGRTVQSVTESSFDAWIKLYQPDENTPNVVISYYTKGALIALLLDLNIRQSSDNQKSLDDVMRLLWQSYGKVGRGVTENDMETILTEIGGNDMAAFLQQALYEITDLPLQSSLAQFGIDYQLTCANSKKAQTKTLEDEDKPTASLGVIISKEGSEQAGVKVKTVLSGSASEKAGIAAGDVLIALDDLKLYPTSFSAQISRLKVDQSVKVVAFRRDELMNFKVTLQASPCTTCLLAPQEKMTPEAQQRFDAWLVID